MQESDWTVSFILVTNRSYMLFVNNLAYLRAF